MNTNKLKSLPELSDEFILDALNSSQNFEELSKKLNCYKKNLNYRKRNIFHYLNLIGIYEMTYEQLKENYNKHNYEDRYCLKCGKKLSLLQIRTNNKFCSKKCANSYNTSGRKLTEETKSNIRNGLINSPKYKENLAKRREEKKQRDENCKKRNKQNNCKICGRPLIDGKCQNDFCIKHKNTKFEKLSKYFGFDISKFGTEEVEIEFNRIREIIYDLYWNKHMSSIQFESMFNLTKNTIFHYFKLFDIPTKTISFAMKESFQENRTKIPFCDHFKGIFHTHITWDNKEVHLRSINEIEYAKLLDSLKIIYDVESLRIRYFDTLKKDYRYAIPDFYLPETNTIVEVKSAYTLDVINMKDRCKEFANLGYNFKLIFEFKEMTLDEILENELYDYDMNKNILKRIYENKRKDGGWWINKDGIVKKCYKLKDLELYLDDGWSLGTGNHRKTAGTSRVVKLNEHGFMEYKLIPRSELKEYLNNGWFKGKTLKYEILELLKLKSD